MMKMTQTNKKHVPQRTCIACREVKPKHQLIRIVYTIDGKVEVDYRGKKSGRGAYICHSPLCWEKGLKKGRLDRALKNKLSAEDGAKLAELSKML